MNQYHVFTVVNFREVRANSYPSVKTDKRSASVSNEEGKVGVILPIGERQEGDSGNTHPKRFFLKNLLVVTDDTCRPEPSIVNFSSGESR